jgi:DNA-binding NarL/FixJ family response regulator
LNKIRVLIADDHAAVRDGFRLLVDSQADMECVGEAKDGRAAIELARELLPDIVIMDVSMPGMNGLKATEKIKQVAPQIKVLMMTRHTEEGYLQELIRAGASGYVLKQSPSSELLGALRAVAAGNNYLDQTLTGRVMDGYVGRHRGAPEGSLPGRELSEREADVLRLIAWGYGNKEIGARLSISVKTVDVHKANAQKKLGLKGRVDIVRYALLQGWLKET